MCSTYSVLIALGFAVISVFARSDGNVCTLSRELPATLTCILEEQSDHEYVKNYSCGTEKVSRVELQLLRKSQLSSKDLPNLKIYQLFVEGKNLKGVSKDAFADQEPLSLVSISKSALDEIPTAALKRVLNLETVILNENHIRSIDCSLRNTALKGLTLRDNDISLVHSCAFPPTLRTMSLANNLIEALNGSLKSLGSLEWLFIDRNRLTSLEGELRGLKKLTNLDASWNKVKSFGLSPVDLTELGSINLAHNRISELGSLRGLSSLVEFDVSFNELEALKAETFRSDLSSLSVLNLSGNRIRTLEDLVFWNLENLQTLIISKNAIRKLDGKLMGLRLLAKLDASHNYIATVENSFADLIALEELDLSYNGISSIKDGLSTLSRLRLLNLEMNSIKAIDAETFSSLRNLRELNLSWNPLGRLDGKIFVPLTKITTLDLTYIPTIKLDSLLVPGFMNISLSAEGAAAESKCDCARSKLLKLAYTSCGSEVIASKAAVLQASDIKLTCV